MGDSFQINIPSEVLIHHKLFGFKEGLKDALLLAEMINFPQNPMWCECAYRRICACVYMHIYICIHIYIHTHIYIFTYIYIPDL